MKNDKKTSSVSFNIDGKIETIKIENNTKIKFIKEPVKDVFIFDSWKLNNKIVLKHTCPPNCLQNEDLKTCTKITEISLSKTYSCNDEYF